MNFSRLLEAINKAEKIILISHQKPDGDACGSVLAMFLYLRFLGKSPTAFLVDYPSEQFSFLPAIELIQSNREVLLQDWDLAIVLDSAALDYTGIEEDLFPKQKNIVNVDHHFSNDLFGAINMVDDKASSTCEIVYRFLDFCGFEFDKNVAICLMTGMLTDTVGFTNSATNSVAIAATSKLMKTGAKIKTVINNVVYNKSVAGLKMWGIALLRLSVNNASGLAYTYVIESELKRHNIAEEEIDGLVNFLNVLVDVPGVAFFRINSTHTKVSLRTASDDINMANLAEYFGGGGHQKAAGFTLSWPIKESDGILRFI